MANNITKTMTIVEVILMLTHSSLRVSETTNKQTNKKTVHNLNHPKKDTCNLTTKITFMTWLYSMSEGHQQANDKANKTTKTMTIDEVILAHRHAYYAD